MIQNNRTFRALWDGDTTEFDLNAGYAELEWNIWRFRFTGGARSEYFSLSKDTAVGPRLGAEFAIPETNTTLLAGAGNHYSLPSDLSQISIESGNPDLKMEKAEHMALGLEQKIGKQWMLKVEAYRNVFSNLVVSDKYILNPWGLRTNRRDLVEKTSDIIKNPVEDDPLVYSNDGTGHSTGFEFMIKKEKKKAGRGWLGWLSYSKSSTYRNNHQPRMTDDERKAYTQRTAGKNALYQTNLRSSTFTYYEGGHMELVYDNDKEELYDLDRTHQLNLVLNYAFNQAWSLGGKWTYMSQTPYTPITGSKQADVGISSRTMFFPVYSDNYNSKRLSDYHQLDVRLDRFFHYDGLVVNSYIEFINAYARQNEEKEVFNNMVPYLAKTNPTVTYASTYYETKLGKGKRVLWPQLNLGMEVKF
jgi:outer membrane cobalamin receptor